MPTLSYVSAVADSGGGPFQLPPQLVIDVFHEPFDQVSLAAKVDVKGSLGNARFAGDLGKCWPG